MMVAMIFLFINLVSDLKVFVAYLKVKPSSSKWNPVMMAVLRLSTSPAQMVPLSKEPVAVEAAVIAMAAVDTEVEVLVMVVVTVGTAAAVGMEVTVDTEAVVGGMVEVMVAAVEEVGVTSVGKKDILLGTVPRAVEAADMVVEAVEVGDMVAAAAAAVVVSSVGKKGTLHENAPTAAIAEDR